MRRRLKASEVNHLRWLLAWMRCEYMLDENMQKGYAGTAKWMVENGVCTEDEGRKQLAEKAAEIRKVPIYVRNAIKQLYKLVRESDAEEGEVVDHSPGQPRKARTLVSQARRIESPRKKLTHKQPESGSD